MYNKHIQYNSVYKVLVILFTDMAATNNLARRVNHHRKILRPQDPQTLDFQLDLNHVEAGFVRGDIRVDQKRHIGVASDYQMELLCNATHWYLHIIMHIYFMFGP